MRPTVAHARDRANVRGGGRKPWRQKGTGRARHGSTRSPIWKGGGVTHGPLKEKDYSKKINKKMARRALYTVLSAKARDNEILVLDGLKLEAPKTKIAVKIFSDLATVKNDLRSRSVLLLYAKKDENTKRAVRNLPNISLDEARNLTAYEALANKYLLFVKDALSVFTK